MTPHADQFEWDDTSEVRARPSTPDGAFDVAVLHALEGIARSASARDARRRSVALRALLGDGVEPFERLIDSLVARAEELERMRRLATRDELTGIANRRSFNEALAAELARTRRAQRPLSVLIFDLDGLKAINDRHGHAAGDEALREVAGRARDVVREGDLVARLGGDEFVLLLPDTGKRGARAIGERIRAELKALDLGISFGVATTRGPSTLDARELVVQADEALYRDKTARNTLRPTSA